MVKNKVYWLLGSAGIVFLFGCSSKEKNTQRNSTARTVEYKMYEQESQSIQGPTVNLDSLKSHSVSDTQHNGNSGIDLSVNPYYDEGYDQGQEDGYNEMGLRTCEVILMMTLAVIRGKNERSTNLVMKKAMRQALMTALLIVIMILKMKNS